MQKSQEICELQRRPTKNLEKRWKRLTRVGENCLDLSLSEVRWKSEKENDKQLFRAKKPHNKNLLSILTNFNDSKKKNFGIEWRRGSFEIWITRSKSETSFLGQWLQLPPTLLKFKSVSCLVFTQSLTFDLTRGATFFRLPFLFNFWTEKSWELMSLCLLNFVVFSQLLSGRDGWTFFSTFVYTDKLFLLTYIIRTNSMNLSLNESSSENRALNKKKLDWLLNSQKGFSAKVGFVSRHFLFSQQGQTVLKIINPLEAEECCDMVEYI